MLSKSVRVFLSMCMLVLAVGSYPQTSIAAPNLSIIVNNDGDLSDTNPADTTCDSDAGTPGPQCTLRAAIETAQGNAGRDDIDFSGNMSITLGAPLPVITEIGLTIAATPPEVKVIGSGITGAVFRINGTDITLQGLSIFGAGAGYSNIWVMSGAREVIIAENLIGDDQSGDGGCGQSDQTDAGIYLDASPAETLAWIYGNKIECNAGNPGAGIALGKTTNVIIGANQYGEATEDEQNAIQHNDTGIIVDASLDTLITNNLVQQNGTGIYLFETGGTTISNNIVSGNTLAGIELADTTGTNLIGCSNSHLEAEVCRNQIHSNGGPGIKVDSGGAAFALIQDNWIGVSEDGSAAAPNQHGILITGDVSGLQIMGNLISGNLNDGIRISASGGGHRISGNQIGLDASGMLALPNQSQGIYILDDTGANIIGASAEFNAPGNYISGNLGFGILVDNSDQTQINLNMIGLATDNLTPLGNGYAGISLENSQDHAVGTYGDPGSQRIFANGEHGIDMNAVQYSQIGAGNQITDNQTDGIYNFAGQNNLINPHLVRHNGGSGIHISGATAYNISVIPTAVYGNAGLPIDFGPEGLEPNDPGDTDDGPNHYLNYPEVTIIAGKLITGTVCADCFVAIYQTYADPDQNGGGGFIRTSVQADAGGVWSLDLSEMRLDNKPLSFVAMTGLPSPGNYYDTSPISPSMQLSYEIFAPLVHE